MLEISSLPDKTRTLERSLSNCSSISPVLPLAEVVTHAALGNQVHENHMSLASCFETIKNRVHDMSERMFSLSFLRIDDFCQ